MSVPKLQLKTLRWRIFWTIVFGALISSLTALSVSVIAYDSTREDKVSDLYDLTFLVGSLVYSESGQLSIDTDHWTIKLVEADNPDLWFVILVDGEAVVSKNEPDWFSRIDRSPSLLKVESRYFYEDDDVTKLVYERQYSRQDNFFSVMVGGIDNGSMTFLLVILRTIAPLFVILLFVAILFALVISMLITHGLNKSVSTLKADLSAVDFDQAFQPITDDRTPRELQPLLGSFNTTLGLLHDTYGQQRKFATELTHELRTPIAAVMAQIQLLEPSQPHQAMLERLTQLHGFISQLLDNDRLRWADTARAPVDIVPLVRNVAAQLAPLAVGAGREITLSPEQPSIEIVTDATAISHVVHNLIANAILHGEGLISVAINRDRETNQITIAVSDEGVALQGEDPEQLLEILQNGSGNGSGLGLSIVHNIMQKLGGILDCETGSNQTEFTITLPRNMT